MNIRVEKFKVVFIVRIFIVLVGSISAAFSQNNDIRFEHYTVEDGLSQNSVYAILQDHHGFMWFGTRTGGLNKFNGYSFTSYKKNIMDSLSISGNEILSLCEDDSGMLWIGTRNDGLNRYDENTNHFYSYYPDSSDSTSISSKTIGCIYKDTKGRIWFGTNYGLCMYNREKDNFIWHADKYEFRVINIKVIKQVDDDLFWIGAKSGIYLYNIETREILKHYTNIPNDPRSLSESYIMGLAVDVNGKLWAGTYRGGLNRLDDPEKGVFTRFNYDNKNSNSVSSNVIRSLYLDKKGVLWIATKEALDKVLPNQQNSTNPVFIHYQK
jgi:ligand-binding sensor domain-containing protein